MNERENNLIDLVFNHLKRILSMDSKLNWIRLKNRGNQIYFWSNLKSIQILLVYCSWQNFLKVLSTPGGRGNVGECGVFHRISKHFYAWRVGDFAGFASHISPWGSRDRVGIWLLFNFPASFLDAVISVVTRLFLDFKLLAD